MGRPPRLAPTATLPRQPIDTIARRKVYWNMYPLPKSCATPTVATRYRTHNLKVVDREDFAVRYLPGDARLPTGFLVTTKIARRPAYWSDAQQDHDLGERARQRAVYVAEFSPLQGSGQTPVRSW